MTDRGVGDVENVREGARGKKPGSSGVAGGNAGGNESGSSAAQA
jgi:hypothetical protein